MADIKQHPLGQSPSPLGQSPSPFGLSPSPFGLSLSKPLQAQIASSEFILGGQRSGKSRRAELIARQWLDASPHHRTVMIATGQAWDDEMRERIARHQRDRAERVPGMVTVEEPVALASVLRAHSAAQTLRWNSVPPVRQASPESAVTSPPK